VFSGFGIGKRFFGNNALALQYTPGTSLDVVQPSSFNHRRVEPHCGEADLLRRASGRGVRVPHHGPALIRHPGEDADGKDHRPGIQPAEDQ